METKQNILLIRLRSMGDVLFTLPAVRLVREVFPSATITFLVSREYAPLLEGFRDVDETISVDRARYRRGNPISICLETLSLLRVLRRGKFSLVVDFQGYGETAWLAWWTGAPRRWGSVYRPARRWAYTRYLNRDGLMHPVEWNLSLLHHCGLHPARVLNEFAVPDSALEEARRLLAAHKLALDCPTLFIQPFTSTPAKNWPLDRYIAVAKHWRERGLQVLFGGGPAECAALEPARQAGFAVSAGVPLNVSAGLAKLSTLTLGGDTGLLHLAVAMDRRVTAIIPSMAPGSPHPFQHPEWAVAPPAGLNISAITTEAVIEACGRAFSELDVHFTPVYLAAAQKTSEATRGTPAPARRR